MTAEPLLQTRIGIVASRFNRPITDKLLDNALEVLQSRGIPKERIALFRVPGALELPLVAKKMALSGRFDALICLGAVIKGETYHFEMVCHQSAQGILQVSLDTALPVINGVLTTYTEEQALERAEKSGCNKGAEFALAALDMIALLNCL